MFMAKGLAIWTILLLVAIANGAARVAILKPRLGVSGHTWEELVADYDLLQGRFWVLVLAMVFVAPLVEVTVRAVVAARPASAT